MADIIDLSPQLIGTPANGVNLYQVPNASMIVLQDVINAAWNEGLSAKTSFSAKISAASAAIDALLASPGSLHITSGPVSVPTVVAPSVVIPSSIDVSDILLDFDAKYADITAALTGQFATFQSTYFPNDSATYTAAENWIQAALANPNAGLPLAVQSQILADDQARTLSDATRASDAVLSAFAARRYPMPPGAAASAVLQIQQKAQDLVAESSRKVAVMSVEMMKFAVEKAMVLRHEAMSDALDYIKALTSAPDIASRMVGVGYDAQSKLISSAAQFYGADTNAKEMMSKVDQFNSTLSLEASSKNQAADMGLLDDKIKALLAEAQSIAQMASALFNNLHASVSMQAGGSTVTTQSQDVS